MEFSFLLTSSSRDFYVVLYGSTMEISSFLFKAGFHQPRSQSRRRTKPITKRGIVHSDWLILPLLLPTATIWFSLDHKRNVSDGVVSGVGRKWKRSDSSDSDSVALVTPLTTPIFDFHSYNSAYHSDSDSVASENQPMRDRQVKITESSNHAHLL